MAVDLAGLRWVRCHFNENGYWASVGNIGQDKTYCGYSEKSLEDAVSVAIQNSRSTKQ